MSTAATTPPPLIVVDDDDDDDDDDGDGDDNDDDDDNEAPASSRSGMSASEKNTSGGIVDTATKRPSRLLLETACLSPSTASRSCSMKRAAFICRMYAAACSAPSTSIVPSELVDDDDNEEEGEEEEAMASRVPLSTTAQYRPKCSGGSRSASRARYWGLGAGGRSSPFLLSC